MAFEVPFYLFLYVVTVGGVVTVNSQKLCFYSVLLLFWHAKRKCAKGKYQFVSISDLEREIGYRYLQQLESDITSVRNRLTSSPESEIKKPSNCTCAIMERQFLEMAESAYRSVRRIDASPRGFEQFKRELIQTNEIMKDSMQVLKNIRAFCEHKC